MKPIENLAIFTDLDGCLLNKHDYDWRPAEACLLRLRDLKVPVVFASSKTVAEISVLAAEVPCIPAPFIAENGGSVFWGPLQSEDQNESQTERLTRPHILEVLSDLKSQFEFRSFNDLGLEGVMEATDLPRMRAELAMQWQSTEPLLWDDSPAQLDEFEQILQRHKLSLTKGGRFWHVAGRTTKGKALQQVRDRLKGDNCVSVAIGDSPIDQSMLDVVDIPVGIRVNGDLNVNVLQPPGIVPQSEGAAGWAESVTAILSQFV